VNWLAGYPPTGDIRALVKIRYKARFAPCTVTPIGEDGVSIRLDDPLPDITPGQGAVLYDGDRVIGSGIIA
jgi:tRNA-specific 2-thiouridylase